MEEYKRSIREREARRRKRRQKQIVCRVGVIAAALALGLGILLLCQKLMGGKEPVLAKRPEEKQTKYIETPPFIDVQLLPVNEYSRPGTRLDKVNGIVVHYTANPGTTAQQNHDYFEGLAKSGATSVSSQFIVGLEGEIIQCVPCDEVAYASNHRNNDTISIECCIEDETGRFNNRTYASLVELTAWLIGEYGLETEDVIRHYDVTGKNCPKYFVEDEEAWEKFKQDLQKYINENGTEKKG